MPSSSFIECHIRKLILFFIRCHILISDGERLIICEFQFLVVAALIARQEFRAQMQYSQVEQSDVLYVYIHQLEH